MDLWVCWCLGVGAFALGLRAVACALGVLTVSVCAHACFCSGIEYLWLLQLALDSCRYSKIPADRYFDIDISRYLQIP